MGLVITIPDPVGAALHAPVNSCRDRLVLVDIARRANCHGVAVVSIEAVAAVSLCGLEQARRTLARLVHLGHLEPVEGHPYAYRLTLDERT